MSYDEACARARKQSEEGYVQHVNALIRKEHGEEPRIVGYTVSDWCDGTTVASYRNGRECER